MQRWDFWTHWRFIADLQWELPSSAALGKWNKTWKRSDSKTDAYGLYWSQLQVVFSACSQACASTSISQAVHVSQTFSLYSSSNTCGPTASPSVSIATKWLRNWRQCSLRDPTECKGVNFWSLFICYSNDEMLRDAKYSFHKSFERIITAPEPQAAFEHVSIVSSLAWCKPR